MKTTRRAFFHRTLRAKAQEILPNVFHLHFRSHKKMVDTFLRPRECYESASFYMTKFKRSEFEQWYSDRLGKGKFTYYEDWGGFNLPVRSLALFMQGVFNPLSREEKHLVKLGASLNKNSYLIATSQTAEKEYPRLDHELAHALFAINKTYRTKVKAILGKANLSPVYEWLKQEGYHRTRLLDEAHAYLLEGAQYLKSDLGISAAPYRDVIRRLKSNFRALSQKEL